MRENLDNLIDDGRRDAALAAVESLSPVELQDILLSLSLRRARQLYSWLPPRTATKVLAEVSTDLRAVLLQDADADRIVAIADGLDDDDVVELLMDFPDEAREELLLRLPNAADLRLRLAFDEDSAGGVMSNKFVALLDDWNVGTAIRMIRRKAADIEKFYEAYVVDEDRRLVGTLNLRDLLLSAPHARIGDIMHAVGISVGPDADQEDVFELATRHKVQTVPVVDADRHVIGRITVDELHEIVRDEAEEDMKLMSGVAPDAQPDDTLGRMIRGRLPWLIGGLVGAVLAGLVVGSFESELKRAAILASFIPVVMAMAGNAGIQASTITVQGLAAGNLWVGDLGGRLAKELLGSMINGLVIASLLVVVVLGLAQVVAIDAPERLALAAGLSVAIVTTMAATLGAAVPLLLERFDIDPAVATGVFITTGNDILGVLVYFLMASAIYIG